MKRQYFIQERSLWQGDAGRLIGPFASRKEAQQFADEFVANNSNNLADVRQAYVLSKTAILRNSAQALRQQLREHTYTSPRGWRNGDSH